jgi:hypothetical protein
MNKIGKLISPLFLVGLWMIGSGIYVFTKDPGEEGWGYLAASMVCLFSIPPFLIDFILKKVIKDRRRFFLIQIPIALLTLGLYWKWTLIG